jgi:hypothetical protein
MKNLEKNGVPVSAGTPNNKKGTASVRVKVIVCNQQLLLNSHIAV